MVHVKFVEKYLVAFGQDVVARSAGFQRYLGFVEDGLARAVEILPESDVEQSRSRSCDVEPID